ncbi:MAG: UDP-2,3-diacylglucosamine hydrolase [Sulfurimonas sp.]|jgi:UDP-2,3-diacylglucosamine hydrolase|uniref:UDP-2,3-diacylglucosamine diphosphatase n=1 Tax=Sulfurimonas sp. TaxID=2022749 RepID=UPI0039E3CBC6
MSHNLIQIQEGAYIISDAHFSNSRPELFYLIQDIHSKKITPTQLLLFGDIFDALFGSVSKSIEVNQDMITMLNDISKEMEIVYMEGNHDFNLKNIFPNIRIFTIAQQPVACLYEDKKVFLAHGDFGEDLGYRIYTSIIRNRFFLPVFNFINTILGNIILEKLDVYLRKKEDCNEFSGFKKYIASRLENKYECDYFIEGHFHQNKIINFDSFEYINLAAFACNQRYFIVESSKDKLFLKENNFHKEI